MTNTATKKCTMKTITLTITGDELDIINTALRGYERDQRASAVKWPQQAESYTKEADDTKALRNRVREAFVAGVES